MPWSKAAHLLVTNKEVCFVLSFVFCFCFLLCFCYCSYVSVFCYVLDAMCQVRWGIDDTESWAYKSHAMYWFWCCFDNFWSGSSEWWSVYYLRNRNEWQHLFFALRQCSTWDEWNDFEMMVEDEIEEIVEREANELCRRRRLYGGAYVAAPANEPKVIWPGQPGPANEPQVSVSQAQPMTPEGAYIGSQAKPIPAGPQWAKEANWPAASRSDDDASGGSDEHIPQSPMM
jgi:hypothetical protein